MEVNKIYCGDTLTVLKTFPDESIDMCLCSPPYWALRSYLADDDPLKKYELGLEPTLQEYIQKLCDIFDEVKRVLRKDGTCWVNLGDTYASSPAGGCGNQEGTDGVYQRLYDRHTDGGKREKSTWKPKNYGNIQMKSLCQIPSRFSIEMCNRGWILRNVIVWHKPNCMPSSARDRFTNDFEYIYFFVKSKKYYFERQFEAHSEAFIERVKYGWKGNYEKGETHYNVGAGAKRKGFNEYLKKDFKINKQGRNKRCVWKIATQSYSEAHFATYPEELCITPIKSGCPEFVCTKCGKAKERIYSKEGNPKYTEEGNPQGINRSKMKWNDSHPIHNPRWWSKFNDEGYTSCNCNAEFKPGIVLDPFAGAGTTCMVAKKLNRNYVGIELNAEYIRMAEKRIERECGGLI